MTAKFPDLITDLRSPYGPWKAAYSLDALRRAWASVRGNKGGSGSDGQTIAEFEADLENNLHQLQRELVEMQYQPKPVKAILIPKANANWRPLTLWAIRDRVAQRATYDYLEPVFDRQFLPCSFGFRNGRSTQDAAQAIAQARANDAEWVLDADIEDCFGQMQNKIVLKQLQRWHVPGPIRELVRRWLVTKIGNAWRPDQTTVGTSQGSALSPLLCNLYLHPFDRAMQQPGITLVRYADDFVILAKRQASIKWAQHWAGLNLKRIGLNMHAHKTSITSFETGFQFVGWFFVGNEMYRLSK
ncbi:MAG: group II intron reverse transcriptase/maturase [Ardenticatenaceae bacterium]|nr:group II intron reverse transcriptase/maturase [Ardenticatenaceae bacterium]